MKYTYLPGVVIFTRVDSDHGDRRDVLRFMVTVGFSLSMFVSFADANIQNCGTENLAECGKNVSPLFLMLLRLLLWLTCLLEVVCYSLY